MIILKHKLKLPTFFGKSSIELITTDIKTTPKSLAKVYKVKFEKPDGMDRIAPIPTDVEAWSLSDWPDFNDLQDADPDGFVENQLKEKLLNDLKYLKKVQVTSELTSAIIEIQKIIQKMQDEIHLELSLRGKRR